MVGASPRCRAVRPRRPDQSRTRLPDHPPLQFHPHRLLSRLHIGLQLPHLRIGARALLNWQQHQQLPPNALRLGRLRQSHSYSPVQGYPAGLCCGKRLTFARVQRSIKGRLQCHFASCRKRAPLSLRPLRASSSWPRSRHSSRAPSSSCIRRWSPRISPSSRRPSRPTIPTSRSCGAGIRQELSPRALSPRAKSSRRTRYGGSPSPRFPRSRRWGCWCPTHRPTSLACGRAFATSPIRRRGSAWRRGSPPYVLIPSKRTSSG